MKNKKLKQQYFFVDEAGDPTFYNQYGQFIVGTEGCSRVLLLGFIKTEYPEEIRKAILSLQKEMAGDHYLYGIPSFQKTQVAFHAKDDSPEVREKVYKMLVGLDFTAEFIVARKIEKIFRAKHKGKESLFYDDLIVQLFKNKLHLAEKNYIYFATRGNKIRQEPLEDAIRVAINSFETTWQTTVDSQLYIYPQTPSGEPCLQIVDYMNWAVQRAFHRGEDRYYKFVQEKVSFLADIYDFSSYPKNFYNRKNIFDIIKIGPL